MSALRDGDNWLPAISVLPVAIGLALALVAAPAIGEDLGRLSINPFTPGSTSAPGAEFGPGPANPFSPSGQAARNQFAVGGARLYDDAGEFRGVLNGNRFDPNSVANPYGRYGSPYSADSINNAFGAGSPFGADSPNNPFGTGLRI